jgi:hypothetical protein
MLMGTEGALFSLSLSRAGRRPDPHDRDRGEVHKRDFDVKPHGFVLVPYRFRQDG